MAAQKSFHSNGPQAKLRKLDVRRNDVAADSNDGDEEEIPISNLIDDCLYAILDWLSRKDLCAFGQTCKWAQQIAIDFYKLKHSAIDYKVLSRPIAGPDVFDLKNAQKLCIQYTSKQEAYRQIETHCIEPIKKICLSGTTLSVEKVQCPKGAAHS